MTRVTRRTFLVASGAALLAPARGQSADAAIEVASVWGPDKPFQKIVDAFNARRTGVTVTNRFDGSYEETARKALAAVAAGRPPAMMVTGWKFGQFARRALGARDLREIDAARTEALIARFVPGVRPLVTVDGALIGLPWSLSTPITYVDLGLWQAAGLDPALPAEIDTDWLYARAREVQARLGGRHATYRSAIDLSNNEWTSQAFIQNAGGFIIDPEGAVALDSPEARRGMELFAEPALAGLWLPVSADEQVAAFDAGALAITTTSSASSLSFGAARHRPVATTRFPGVPGRPRRMNSGGNFLAIYAREAERALAALSFLEYCASEEGQRLWSATGYLNSSIHDIPLASPLQAPAAAQLRDGLTAETIWPGSRGLQGQDVWRKWVTRMLTKDVGVADGLRQARAELVPLLKA